MKAILAIEPITAATFSMEALAAWLAREPDIMQAAFFNQFDIELRKACQGDGSFGPAMQCLYISHHLTPDAADTLQDISKK